MAGPIGHLVFDGPTRQLKMFYVAAPGEAAVLRHTLVAHDVGIADGTLADPFGRNCKAPPGLYFIGEPQACALRNADGTATPQHDDDRAYGCWFTPLIDDPTLAVMAGHGRAGIGIHGGGSGAPDPFALQQGWFPTEGCLRLQNADNETTLVPFITTIRHAATAAGDDPDRAVTLSVFWGARC